MSDSYTPFQPLRYDQQQVSRQGWGMAASGPTDDQMNVGFYPGKKPTGQLDPGGKAIWVTVDKVKISHPGEANLMQTDREVTEQDKFRWPRQWAQYKAGQEQVPDGIPLDLLFPNHPHIPQNLRGHGIHTIEQLAKLSGHGLQAVGMGAQEWVNAANRYVQMAEKGVSFHKFEMALKTKDQEIATLKRQISDLAALVQNRTSDFQPQPQPRRPYQPSPPQDFDYQTAQINDTHASSDDSQAILQPPAQFAQDIGSIEPPKRRGGRPKGSTNKPKEI